MLIAMVVVTSLSSDISVCIQCFQLCHKPTGFLVFNLFTLFSCIKKTVQSCVYFGCRAVGLPTTEQIAVHLLVTAVHSRPTPDIAQYFYLAGTG